MIKLSKLYIIFIFILVNSTFVNAISSQWSCGYGEPPFGNIDIIYTNENTINTAEIYAITPQKHPIIYPGGELILQLNSKNCFEYTMKVKDSSDIEILQYSEKPYSPFVECNIPAGESTEGIDFLTMIKFNAPSNYGKYTLDIYDDKKILLTTGAIEILKPSTIVPSIQRNTWCTIDDSNYVITLDAPYPVIFENNNPGKISVIIKGISKSTINEMFNQISMSISPKHAAQISLTKSGNPVCSDGECKQDYSLSSSVSTSAIAYIWQEKSKNSKVAINSEGITILDVGKLKEIKSRLDDLSSTSAEYVIYYNSTNDNTKAQIWQDVYNNINSISDEITNLIPILDSKNLKISNVVDLINITEKSQKYLDEIINSLSGA